MRREKGVRQAGSCAARVRRKKDRRSLCPPPPQDAGRHTTRAPGRTQASRPFAASTAWTGEPQTGKVSRQPHRSDRPSQYDAGTDAMKSANLAMENSFSFGLHSPVPI